MEDKFFDIDEAMVEYSEMNGFNYEAGNYLPKQEEEQAPVTFKYGKFDMLDMLKSMFSKPEAEKV